VVRVDQVSEIPNTFFIRPSKFICFKQFLVLIDSLWTDHLPARRKITLIINLAAPEGPKERYPKTIDN